MNTQSDRRTSPRVAVAQLVVGFPREVHVVVGNLSSGGIGFHFPGSVPLGETLVVQVHLPDAMFPLEVRAVVCHVRQEHGAEHVGARFVDVDDLEQWPIDRYVEEEASRLTFLGSGME